MVNMGRVDAKVRRILAVIFLFVAAPLAYLGAWLVAGVLVALAAVFLVTAQLRWCPLYLPFRFSTQHD